MFEEIINGSLNVFQSGNLFMKLSLIWGFYMIISSLLNFSIIKMFKSIFRSISITFGDMIDSSYDKIEIKKARETRDSFLTKQNFPLFKEKEIIKIKKEEAPIVEKNIVFNQRI